MQVLIIGQESYSPYMRPFLSKYLWGQTKEEQERALDRNAAEDNRSKSYVTKGMFHKNL